MLLYVYVRRTWIISRCALPVTIPVETALPLPYTIPQLNDTIIIESNTLANGNNRMYIITFSPWINNTYKSVFFYSNLRVV